jgi:hypothetical protein
MGPDQSLQDDPEIKNKIDMMTREYGQSARTYKSALFWVLPESSAPVREEARKLLAWEDIENESLNLDESQRKQLDASIKKARRDLTESTWRTYKNVLYLGKDNTITTMDLGLITSSAVVAQIHTIRIATRGYCSKRHSCAVSCAQLATGLY